ncbi:hypothetical protein G6011_01620 [Alternaria panax]|uniref:LCCL domain-containing protein n=1 Tax=Alternaria panax TaxID=48097 RepID=A0AAD4IL27_9PLEO|nr:hypothetical protein G6011_01620 [Alternaria panax]
MAARDTCDGVVPEAIDLEHGTKRDHNRDRVTPSGQNTENAAPHHQLGRTPPWTRKLRDCTPAPVVRWSRKVGAWAKGPKPPSRLTITPVLERWQTLPVRLLARLPGWMRICIYAVTCALWIIVFAVVLSNGRLPSDIGGLGAPVKLSCVNNLWPSPESCGLDGRNCFPFSNASFAFNCPAGCSSAQVLNPRAIGPQTINYRSLVVGGAPGAGNDALVYRGDSFICPAAIHAGVTSNGNGGCGVLSLIGERDSFGAVTRHGISSIGFDSHFPMAFSFGQASAKCKDPRWSLLILSTIFTALFGIFTTSPAAFFTPIFTILFFQTGMASDPPSYSNYASLASTTLGRFLPAALAAALLYRFSVRQSLRNCKAQVEKTVLWVGGAWVGALGNYTFERIPIQRLTGNDIRQQPGAITALVIIVLILFAVVLYQAWCFRKEGRLPRYLALYATLGLGLGILAAMPKLTLRIHHYIIALLLLPGTALQTRVSLLCQGLLVGLFVNGIARWDFDSILQTAAALRGDGQLGSGIPAILEPITNGSSITFAWESLLRGYQGVSVVVNDVERYRGSGGSDQGTFTWSRLRDGKDEYFRFGYISYQLFGSVAYSDFTRAGTWFSNGTWSGIPPGRT